MTPTEKKVIQAMVQSLLQFVASLKRILKGA